jgi:hypothetical protein
MGNGQWAMGLKQGIGPKKSPVHGGLGGEAMGNG